MLLLKSLLLLLITAQISLLQAQVDQIEVGNVVKVGITHAPPLIILEKNKSPQGMLIDFINEVAEREQFKIKWVDGTWSSVFNLAKNAELDLMTYIAYTPERAQYFDFSTIGFVTGWGQVYTYSGSKYQNILDFNDKKIAVIKDDIHANGIIEVCVKFNVKCDLIEVENYTIAFNMLENKLVDGVVCGSTLGHTYENNFNIERTSIMYNPTKALFATPKSKNSKLLSAIDRYLEQWKNDAHSPYSLSKVKWMGDKRKIIPVWLLYFIISTITLLIVSTVFVYLLRKQIKKHLQNHINQTKQLNQIINLVPHMIYVVNSDGQVVIANNYASDYFGVSKNLTTSTFDLLEKTPQYKNLFEGDVDLLKNGKNTIKRDVTCKNSMQEETIISVEKVPFATQDNLTSVLTVGIDKTEEFAYQTQIKYMAEHDELTGLPNRQLLKNNIQSDLQKTLKNNTYGSVLYIDLDFFKNVNDSLGHVIGDELLQSVANRLIMVLQGKGYVSRIGGDEFLINLNTEFKSIDVIRSRSISIAKDVLKTISTKFSIQNQSLNISSSIGIVIYPEDADCYDQVMQRADIAMYEAKSNGRNSYEFFKNSMEHDILKKQKTVSELHNALENSEFFLEYQPQIDIEKEAVIGLEALIRWKHPSGKVVQPNDFISIAEEGGLMIPIGYWVIEEVFKQLSLWVNKFNHIPFVTINLSVLQLHNDNFVENIILLFHKYSVPAYLVEFELTESILIDEIDKTIYTLSQLKNLGLRLSIDDFGTGYSSLRYLKKLPFDKLKIDYSFVKDIITDEETRSIVKTIIGMTQDLGLEVIAEGVETNDQLEMLIVLECHKFQGFFFDPASSIAYIEQKYLVKHLKQV